MDSDNYKPLKDSAVIYMIIVSTIIASLWVFALWQ